MVDEYEGREQSKIKHFALGKYLEPATRIIGSGWAGFTYVDCCAGPWESQSGNFSDTSFGLSVSVLKESQRWLAGRGRGTKFRALLIEQKPEPFKELARFAAEATGEQVQVEARNWDFLKHTSEIIRYVANPRSFSFIFVDPTGWTPADAGKLAPLLRIRPGEILINFMSAFIVRFLNDPATNMESILGPDYRSLRDLGHEEQEDEAVRRYCDLIRKEGGFDYVCALPVMKGDRDEINFYLIYGTRNAKGVDVFKQVEKKTEQETALVRALRQQSKRSNLDLFGPDVLYRREERYRRLASRRRLDATKALQRLLLDRKTVSYDDCWAEALQFPTFYESDLRGWLERAESAGEIRIDGKTRKDELLRRGRNLIVVKLRFRGQKGPHQSRLARASLFCEVSPPHPLSPSCSLLMVR